MIKNLVFDMGNTLLVYDPRRFVDERVRDKSEADLLMRAIFDSPEWKMLDAGTLTDEAFVPIFLARLPERFHASARSLFAEFPACLYRVPDAETLVFELKERGYGLYLLSNASMRFFSYQKNFPVLSPFDGVLISAAERLVKPDERIYRRLLMNFSLDPAECYFVDDLPDNVAGARRCGMDGFVLQNLDFCELRAQFKKLGIL